MYCRENRKHSIATSTKPWVKSHISTITKVYIKSGSDEVILKVARTFSNGTTPVLATLEHPFKKQAHGDERAGFTLLTGCLIPEGTSGGTACARWLCTSLSSAQKELQERSHLGNQPIVPTDVQSRQYTVRCCRSFALSGGNKSSTPI